MKNKKEIRREIEIPQGTEIKIEDRIIKIKGEKEELSKKLSDRRVKVEVADNKLILSSEKTSRTEKRLVVTNTSHVKNLLKGLSEGFVYKLKICSGHFPMNVSVEGNKLKIKNFLGEKIPREAEILEKVKVQVKGTEILVEGHDIEKVGQTASNIEQSTRITNRDRRIFQDGIWIQDKGGKKQF